MKAHPGGHEAAFQMCSEVLLQHSQRSALAIAVSAHSMGIFDSCLHTRTPMPAPVTLCATPLRVVFCGLSCLHSGVPTAHDQRVIYVLRQRSCRLPSLGR